MSFVIEHAWIVVRQLQPGQSLDRTAPSFDLGAGGPAYGGAWRSVKRGRVWWKVRTPAGHTVWFQRVNTYDDAGTLYGIFAVFGGAAGLAEVDTVADLAMPAREAWRRRDEVAIKRFLRSWSVLRVDGFERVGDGSGGTAVVSMTNTVRRIVPEGARLPNYTTTPLPWDLDENGDLTTQALAVFRITGFAGADTLAIEIGLAGFEAHALFRDEPDPGAV